MVGWDLGAVVAKRMLGLLLFIAVDGEIYEVARIDLVVFVDGIFVQKHLGAFLFAVKVDRIEPLW